MDALILSYALDTNGQNARYVKASQRYGKDPRVIKAMALGNQDPGGVVGRFRIAAEKLGGVKIRSAHRDTPYMEFPEDLVWNSRTEPEIRRLMKEADVLHLNNSARPWMVLGGREMKKPVLLHHHGTLFRNGAQSLLDMARLYNMTQAVSTLDLWLIAPEVLTWLPTAYDLDELAALRKPRQEHEKILVVSCPTNRRNKSTNELIEAVAYLQAENYPVELEIVEGKTWKESLAAKARADIFFDQVHLGYGCNGVEAWAMGIPVVAGADSAVAMAMKKEFGRGKLPFYPTTELTIARSIADLVMSADLRAEWGARGLAHVQKYHAELPALERLVSLYMRTIKAWPQAQNAKHRLDWAGGLRLKKGPGMFYCEKYPALMVKAGGHSFKFVAHKLHITDPVAAAIFRDFVSNKPHYGIIEADAAPEPPEPPEPPVAPAPQGPRTQPVARLSPDAGLPRAVRTLVVPTPAPAKVASPKPPKAQAPKTPKTPKASSTRKA